MFIYFLQAANCLSYLQAQSQAGIRDIWGLVSKGFALAPGQVQTHKHPLCPLQIYTGTLPGSVKTVDKPVSATAASGAANILNIP